MISEKLEKTNILHLRSSGGLFGAENVILNLTIELDNRNFNPLIACLDSGNDGHFGLVEEAKRKGLETKNILCRGRIDLKTILELRTLLKENKIDILHCHDYKADFYGFCASRFLNVKLVATNHLWTKETFALRFYELVDAIILNFFDKIIAVSDQVAQEVYRVCIDKKKLLTIYNGIDLSHYSDHINGKKIREEFNIPPSTRIIGAVGRLSVQKGFTYLLESAKEVLRVYSDVKFLIVGNGNLKKYLEEKTARLGIKSSVVFAGFRKNIKDIYASMDIFVHPSIREGLPLVVLEALAMEKPVIATEVGGVPTVIHQGKTGVLLEPKNTQSLVKAILNLLKDRKRADLLALNGRKLIEKSFSARSMAKRYEKMYKELKNEY